MYPVEIAGKVGGEYSPFTYTLSRASCKAMVRINHDTHLARTTLDHERVDEEFAFEVAP